MKTQLFLFLSLLLIVTSVQATIINVPADQPTIQAGIDTASPGDTVLVQPDTYLENIDFNGKNIVLGSLFLTTSDTSYISQTIIDGDSVDSVVKFENGEDSTAVLTGFTITNGSADEGGGIFCRDSDPNLENLYISSNSAGWGGGIYLEYGGVRNYEKSVTNFPNLFRTNNSSPLFGNGVGNVRSSNLLNVTLKGNTAELGGGICIGGAATSVFENVEVTKNFALSGGGIVSVGAEPIMANVTIKENTAELGGGGILCYETGPVFDIQNRCNIYLNQAKIGNDLYAMIETGTISVVVDTFTVKHPTNYYAFPEAGFSFDILHSKVEQVNADLYVDPNTGNNSNSGLSPSDPLSTISCALSLIIADSLNPHIIHLAEGNYSPSSTGESFPIIMPSFISLSGASTNNVVLDAEDQIFVLLFAALPGIPIVENLTITGGKTDDDGGGDHLCCIKPKDGQCSY